MSEQGIDPLEQVNKKLVINTSLLWTGIITTNKKLTDQVKALVENTIRIKELSSIQKSLLIANTANIETLRIGFSSFTTQFKDSLHHLAKIMAESTFANINSMQNLDRTLKDNANMFLRAMGSVEHWESMEEITERIYQEFRDSIANLTTINDGFQVDAAEDAWKAIQEQAQESFDAIYNWGTQHVGKTFEQQIGFIADMSQEFGKLKIEFFEGLLDIEVGMDSIFDGILDGIVKTVNKVLDSGKEGDGKKPKFKKYEGANEFLLNIQKFVDKIAKVGPVVIKKATEFMGKFAKRQVLKAFQQGIGFLKQVINIGTSPAMETLTKTLGSIAKIINVILIPLKPFIFVLEIFGKVLEAALSPMQETLYEALIPFMQDLVESLPELMDMVQSWIDEGLLDEVILGMINAFTGLLDSLIEGNLMKQIFDLSVNILQLATTMISSQLIVSLFKLTGVIIDLAFTLVKPGPGGRTLIEQIIELTVVLGGFALSIFTAFRPLLDYIIGMDIAALGRVIYGMGLAFAFMAGVGQGGGFPWGLVLGGIYAAIWAGVASPLLSLQEGGTVPGAGPMPIMAHGGEQVWSEAKQDDMIELLQEQIYLQKRILKTKEEKYR